MSERTEVSFDAALMMALRADAQKELDELPTPAQLKGLYPDTSRWDARLKAALHKRRPVLKRVLVAALTLIILTLGALAVSADFRKAVYTMIQKFLPIEMQLTYQVDGEPLERLPDGYSDHYVPDGFEMDDAQKFERAENFLHVYSSKEAEESYTVRCSIIQPGQQSLFDNEHTVYETVKVGEADGVLGTSTDEHGKNVYTLSWEHRGITHTVMGNIPYDEIMKIAEGIRYESWTLVRVHKCLAFFLSELTKMENLKKFLLKIETKRMRITLIIQRLLIGAKKRRCMSMSKKRLLSIVISAVILLSFACTAMAVEKSERYVGDSTVNGSIYQTYYQVDAQTRTGVKKISVSGVLYEKGTIGTWQKVSSCSNSSTTSTCVGSGNFNTKPGKSYRLEYSATFSYSDGRSETITGSTSR